MHDRTAELSHRHCERANPPRLRILGVRVDDVTLPEAVDRIRAWARAGEGRLHHVVTVNPEFIIAARRDPAFRATLEAADLATADGVGVILAARLLGRPLRGRVTGVDLVEALAAAQDPALHLFLLGAGPGIAERAAAELTRRYPRCHIAGTWSGSPRPEDAPEILARLRAARPTALLVAFGHPAQDLWIAQHQRELAACGIIIGMGIGGTLDYLAGAVPRPPAPVRRLGLEWLYRLIRQPWRWRRQLALPLFAALVLRERLRRLG
ncbi:MAG: WecB/TagA/CpsF family glycosyltransferase [Sphaerobacter sp.]|nr:WecB/TagA/CpsF family glycosyltransferase [Sphaerobacter sp.]